MSRIIWFSPENHSRQLLTTVIAVCTLLSDCLPCSGQVVKPNSLNVGFLGSLGPAFVTARTIGQPAGLGFLVALQEVNSRTDLLPSTALVGIMNDTRQDPIVSVQVAFDQTQRFNVVGFIGEGDSDNSQSISYISTIYNLPQISYSSTSSLFENKAQYPNFFRTVTSVAQQSIVLARTIHSLGWRRVALVLGTAALSVSAAAAFRDEARLLGLSILDEAAVVSGLPTATVISQLQQLKRSRAHIIGLFATSAEAPSIIRAATQVGLVGADYAWFTHWTLLLEESWLDASKKRDPILYQFYSNIIGAQPRIDTNSTDYLTFAAKCFAFYDPRVTSLLGSSKPPTVRAALAFDATMAMAMALHDVVEVQQVANPQTQGLKVIQALKSVNFTGVTGAVFFDRNGSRVMPYSIVQMRNNDFVVVAEATSSPELKVSFLQPDSPTKGFYYPGGKLPEDDDPFEAELLGDTFVTAVNALSFACLALIVFVASFIIWQRNTARIRAASLTFLLTTLIGCAMGFVGLMFIAVGESDTTAWDSWHSCQTRIWFVSMAYDLVMASLIAKTYRIAAIFDNPEGTQLKTIDLTDAKLAVFMFALVFVETIIDTCWTLIAPQVGVWELSELTRTKRPICASKQAWVFGILSVSYKVLLGIFCGYLAFRVRKAPSLFNEGRRLLLTIYNFGILTLTLLPLSLLLTDMLSTVVKTVGILIALMGTVLILFANFFVVYFSHEEGLDSPSSNDDFAMPGMGVGLGGGAPTSRRGSRSASQRRSVRAPKSVALSALPPAPGLSGQHVSIPILIQPGLMVQDNRCANPDVADPDESAAGQTKLPSPCPTIASLPSSASAYQNSFPSCSSSSSSSPTPSVLARSLAASRMHYHPDEDNNDDDEDDDNGEYEEYVKKVASIAEVELVIRTASQVIRAADELFTPSSSSPLSLARVSSAPTSISQSHPSSSFSSPSASVSSTVSVSSTSQASLINAHASTVQDVAAWTEPVQRE